MFRTALLIWTALLIFANAEVHAAVDWPRDVRVDRVRPAPGLPREIENIKAEMKARSGDLYPYSQSSPRPNQRPKPGQYVKIEARAKSRPGPSGVPISPVTFGAEAWFRGTQPQCRPPQKCGSQWVVFIPGVRVSARGTEARGVTFRLGKPQTFLYVIGGGWVAFFGGYNENELPIPNLVSSFSNEAIKSIVSLFLPARANAAINSGVDFISVAGQCMAGLGQALFDGVIKSTEANLKLVGDFINGVMNFANSVYSDPLGFFSSLWDGLTAFYDRMSHLRVSLEVMYQQMLVIGRKAAYAAAAAINQFWNLTVNPVPQTLISCGFAGVLGAEYVMDLVFGGLAKLGYIFVKTIHYVKLFGLADFSQLAQVVNTPNFEMGTLVASIQALLRKADNLPADPARWDKLKGVRSPGKSDFPDKPIPGKRAPLVNGKPAITPENVDELFQDKLPDGSYGAKSLTFRDADGNIKVVHWATSDGTQPTNVHHRDVAAAVLQKRADNLDGDVDGALAANNLEAGLALEDQAAAMRRGASEISGPESSRTQDSFPTFVLEEMQGFQMATVIERGAKKVASVTVDSAVTRGLMKKVREGKMTLNSAFIDELASQITAVVNSIHPSVRSSTFRIHVHPELFDYLALPQVNLLPQLRMRLGELQVTRGRPF